MFKKWIFFLFTVVFLSGGSTLPAFAKQKNDQNNTPVYYLSLGTSLAAGIQADPTTGESVLTDVSYPSLLSEMINEDINKLRHVNIACPLETTETFIYGGGFCGYPHGSQLDQAVNFLHAHGKFTGLITIDLGANDVLQCVSESNFDFGCIFEKLNQLSIDLAYILETLREVAPDVPIVGMNYYNPLLAYWFQDPDIAQISVELHSLLNSTLENIYFAYHVPVADVEGAFMADDLISDLNGNMIPDSVELVCAWTWMCSRQNIHANDDGYAVIAEQFYSILPEIPISSPPRKRLK